MSQKSRMFLTILIGFFSINAIASKEWLLFSREGECNPTQLLEWEFADIPRIVNPDDFQKYIQSKGLQFTRESKPELGKAVQFNLKSKNISLLFVPREYCSSVVKGPAT